MKRTDLLLPKLRSRSTGSAPMLGLPHPWPPPLGQSPQQVPIASAVGGSEYGSRAILQPLIASGTLRSAGSAVRTSPSRSNDVATAMTRRSHRTGQEKTLTNTLMAVTLKTGQDDGPD